MKIEEIRGKTSDELEIELQKMRREVFDLRFKSSTQALTSPARIRQLRRMVARMETVLTERRLGLRGNSAS
ncbi:MAG: 50S ribosomal protein L29 [Planctomycetia bacterium]|jgi:large subunit ribosomal protein L29